MINYRPFGNLQWLLPKIKNVEKWSICGCISPEDRSIGVLRELHKHTLSIKSNFLIVNDPISPFSPEITLKVDALKKIATSYDKDIIVNEFSLLYDDHSKIYDYIHNFIEISKGDIILDISCLPKRFFFPFVKFFYKSKSIKNFIVTCTSPENYRQEGKLADNCSPWATLPFFSDLEETQKKDIILLGVGHLPMASLEPIQEICASSKLELFFPFPGHAASFILAWKFVHEIKRPFDNKKDVRISHISAVDTSELYDNLITSIDNGANGISKAILAPYGPKPFSLAMAILATNFDVPVFYTQPRLYYPDYSTGIAIKNGIPVVMAYALVLQGQRLYGEPINNA